MGRRGGAHRKSRKDNVTLSCIGRRVMDVNKIATLSRWNNCAPLVTSLEDDGCSPDGQDRDFDILREARMIPE